MVECRHREADLVEFRDGTLGIGVSTAQGRTCHANRELIGLVQVVQELFDTSHLEGATWWFQAICMCVRQMRTSTQ
jgi:hypothetical protein